MERRVERSLVLQHATANVKQFPYGSADDHHLFFSSLGKSIAKGFDCGVLFKVIAEKFELEWFYTVLRRARYLLLLALKSPQPLTFTTIIPYGRR